MFKKILVANRGEVAVRILRACRELGIPGVAVYSEADADSLHLRYADEAYCIGPAMARKSYLNMDAILEVAIRSGADAIHPGYGFLAENAHFARKCQDEGLTFIGPDAEAIEKMGHKDGAKAIMRKAGIPVLPGSEQALENIAQALLIAEKIGYPVILKAAGGGGGMGMRIAYQPKELAHAFEVATKEATGAFGDGAIYLEKYIEKPRHIEIQIMADGAGNIVHLGERECSIQRRYQKLIEEAPSVAVSPELRDKMGEVAKKAALAVNYRNFATVEFLLDSVNNFYFMEMNTRLQVEHTVTEMITGIDIVKEQIKLAAGRSLSYRQADIEKRGWAFECRINAEDFEKNFMPSFGIISDYSLPAGPGIRVDSGIAAGQKVSMYYDSLLAKLIVWDENREEARKRMLRALSEFEIKGIETLIPFHLKVFQHPRFIAGDLDTNFVSCLQQERALSAEQAS